MPKVSLRKGREWQLSHGHPWLFSGGISQPPKVEAGSIVDVVDTDGKFVARGYYNAACDIAVRVLTRDSSETIDVDFLKRRIKTAFDLRKLALDLSQTNVFRLINAEADLLPGFIVDHFDGVIVVQSHTAGADCLLELLIAALVEVIDCKCIIVRNDAGVRKREGIEVQTPRIAWGELPASELVVLENAFRFHVDPLAGQKTGFFTDQREKRMALRGYLQRMRGDADMLNCFSYTGSFSVYCAAALTDQEKRVRTVNVDQSQKALDEAQRNFELNGLNVSQHQFICEDAFDWLVTQRDAKTVFDVVVLDPPAFAKSQKDKARAAKAYTRMNTLGLELTKPGGLMVTCSCSGPISFDEFAGFLKDAAAESGKHVQILQSFQSSADHPISAVAPETGYLKVLFCRVL